VTVATGADDREPRRTQTEEMRMRIRGTRTVGRSLVGVALMVLSLTAVPAPGEAVEVGEPAPEFTLASTNGVDISLSDFRGRKFVLLEFYGSDFAPT
jgi:AhpC/TSA family protein